MELRIESLQREAIEKEDLVDMLEDHLEDCRDEIDRLRNRIERIKSRKIRRNLRRRIIHDDEEDEDDDSNVGYQSVAIPPRDNDGELERDQSLE